jgi:DNA-binding LytR/AlgR family response regulator
MGTPIKILVVEDEMIIGAKISMQLTSLGYEVTGILPRGEEAIVHVKENRPDIILLDINLKGTLNGIDTAVHLQMHDPVPIIYLTANSDETTFNLAKSTKPFAFITKPFKQIDLQRAIELTINRMAASTADLPAEDKHGEEQPFILSDRIFVRHLGKMVKIMLDDILYLEADRNYSRIVTSNREYMLSTTLKIIEEKMLLQMFMRIHRSYLINIKHVDEVTENHVMIAKKPVPLGAGMRERLMQRMQTL